MYAHTKSRNDKIIYETLEEHSEKVMEYYHLLSKMYGWKEVIVHLLQEFRYEGRKGIVPLSESSQEFLKKGFENSIYFHDIGKINPFFQRDKMGQEHIVSGLGRTEHSIFSTIIYLNEAFMDLKEMRIKDVREKRMVAYLLVSFSYAITRHHGSLKDAVSEEGSLYVDRLLHEMEQIESKYFFFYKNDFHIEENRKLLQSIKTFHQKIKEPYVYYLLNKLCHSVLVACDFYGTAYFYQSEEYRFHLFDQEMKDKIPLFYEQDDILKHYQEQKENPKSKSELLETRNINDLRWDLLLEAEKELDQESIVYLLEAPTGGGKTNVSIHLAMKLLQQSSCNKLLYVFPFNTLSEQTKGRLDGFFGDDKGIANVVNSITPILNQEEFVERESEEANLFFEKRYLQHQMLDYPTTLVSHVQLFEMLFGTTRESQLRLCQLCNSVIILDEIQVYRQRKWQHIFRMLSKIGKYYNIRFIIMSATLPTFEHFKEDINVKRLVPNAPFYFQHPLFKERVNLHNDYLNMPYKKTEDVISLCLNIIQKHPNKRLLIECISKKMAQQVFEALRENIRIPVLELTGDDNVDYRKKVISLLKEKNEETGSFSLQEVVLVATQVIEAGVDIDMDIGIKDVSLLDSEEQLLGRINRSCLRKDCHAYFFYSGKVKSIYREDDRSLYNLFTRKELFQTLKNKDFSSFYYFILGKVQERNQRYVVKKDTTLSPIQEFERGLRWLDFPYIKQELLLIDQDNFTLFVDSIMEIEGEIIRGSEVWKEYTETNGHVEGYGKSKIRFSLLKKQMQYFTYNFFQEPNHYDEEVKGMYYLNDGESFMKKEQVLVNGEVMKYKKFNRISYEGE